ncbi:MAG: DNA polymerase III subunit beta [Betaproteobacteria bacterium HGW-Betaproteobacteria-11]|nr:MAG: DNA polymerase III subunit beta [Betaproteobacteria bacterium HGW-Betaproteobacteria-11]
MRLTSGQIALIRNTVAGIAGPEASVKLFGSRLDDKARGGDIDLLVELPHPVQNAPLLASRLEARLERRLGGRKVDVVLAAANITRQPIHEIAAKEGVPLW